MDVYLTTPRGALDPWVLKSYALNVISLKCDVSNSINFHPITDSEIALFSQHEHGITRIIINGIITDNSDFPGSDVEEKKDNLVDGALKWGLLNIKTQSNCAQIVWRGWSQYGAIDNLSIAKTAGDEIEYEYNMEFVISEVR